MLWKIGQYYQKVTYIRQLDRHAFIGIFRPKNCNQNETLSQLATFLQQPP